MDVLITIALVVEEKVDAVAHLVAEVEVRKRQDRAHHAIASPFAHLFFLRSTLVVLVLDGEAVPPMIEVPDAQGIGGLTTGIGRHLAVIGPRIFNVEEQGLSIGASKLAAVDLVAGLGRQAVLPDDARAIVVSRHSAVQPVIPVARFATDVAIAGEFGIPQHDPNIMRIAGVLSQVAGDEVGEAAEIVGSFVHRRQVGEPGAFLRWAVLAVALISNEISVMRQSIQSHPIGVLAPQGLRNVVGGCLGLVSQGHLVPVLLC